MPWACPSGDGCREPQSGIAKLRPYRAFILTTLALRGRRAPLAMDNTKVSMCPCWGLRGCHLTCLQNVSSVSRRRSMGERCEPCEFRRLPTTSKTAKAGIRLNLSRRYKKPLAGWGSFQISAPAVHHELCKEQPWHDRPSRFGDSDKLPQSPSAYAGK